MFVKAGARVKKANRQLHRTGLVHLARDWTFDFHVPEWEAAASYTFPSGVALTNLLPDGVLISRQAKICIIINSLLPSRKISALGTSRKLINTRMRLLLNASLARESKFWRSKSEQRVGFPHPFSELLRSLGFLQARPGKLQTTASF